MIIIKKANILLNQPYYITKQQKSSDFFTVIRRLNQKNLLFTDVNITIEYVTKDAFVNAFVSKQHHFFTTF